MIELLQEGGVVMGLILVGSGIGLAVFLERWLHLHRAQIRTDDFLHGIFTVLRRQSVAEAVSLCAATPGPVASIVRAALLRAPDGREAVLEAIRNVGMEEIPRMETRLRTLSVLSRITPVLGLLGTVLGLMRALISIQQKAPLIQPGDLAQPVWQALICTAAGLVVSVASYAGYHFLCHRVERIQLDMERVAADLVSRSDQLVKMPEATK